MKFETRYRNCCWCGTTISYEIEYLDDGYIRGCPPEFCGEKCKKHREDSYKLARTAYDKVMKEYEKLNDYYLYKKL